VPIAKGAKGQGAGASDVDSLFQLPPTEFTAARNSLAAKLKKSGKTEDAERVKALARPPVSAWAVNQLFWRHRKAFDKLMAAGETFKQVQAAQLAGKSGDIRGPLEARREALSELSKLAVAVLEAGGHHGSPDTMRRVNTTLEALATYGMHPDAPQAGRLTDDVDPPGFEALAALIPRDGGGKRAGDVPKVIPFRSTKPPKQSRKKLDPDEEKRQQEAERKARAAAARAAVQEAERTLRDAKKSAHAAEAALKVAAAKAKLAEREKAEIEARYEKLTARAEETKTEARRVASEAEDAAQAVDDAELALQKAVRELDSRQ
jgi:hypothetical protein